MIDKQRHASTSIEQGAAEVGALAWLEAHLGVRFGSPPVELLGMEPDGFAPGDPPILVEVYAHVGLCKSGQKGKIARDMTKLLLAERLLPDRRARKILAFVCAQARRAVQTGWPGRFAREFGFEALVVDVEPARLNELRAAQERQKR